MKENMSFFPIIKHPIMDYEDGVLFKVPEFCKKTLSGPVDDKNKKCIKHYKEMLDTPDKVKTCPYGFNSFYNSELDEIYSCMTINEYCNFKKVKPKFGKEDIKKNVSQQAFEDLVKSRNYMENIESENQELKKAVSSYLHDVDNYSTHINTRSLTIIEGCDSNFNTEIENEYLNLSKNIWVFSRMSVLRTDLLRQIVKPGEHESNFKERNIFKTYDRVRKCLSKNNVHDVSIHIHRKRDEEIVPKIRSYSSIEYLPFILIDNATKYSVNKGEVNIEFDFDDEYVYVEISNYGPKLDKDEFNKIFGYRYRGKHAKRYIAQGEGIGLCTVKEICDSNGVEIKIREGTYIPRRGAQKNFKEFKVLLKHPIR